MIAAWLATLGWLTVASTGVFVCVSLLNRFVPRRDAGLRHAMLALVLVRLVLPPAVTSPIGVWDLAGGWSRDAPVSSLLAVTHAGLHQPLQAAPTSGDRPGVPWAPILAALWLLGATATTTWLTARRRRYRRLATRGRLVEDGPVRGAVDRWRQLFGLRRPVRLVASPVPIVPFTLGTLRPVVVVPEVMAHAGSGDTATINAVIAHELAHVKRFDDLWLGLQRLVQSLFFFHPIVWLTTRGMAVERELACDRLVLASGTLSPKTYGQSLLRVIGFERTNATVAAAASTHRRLTMRIHHIAKLGNASRPRVLRTFVLVVLLGCALLPSTTTGEPGEPGKSATLTAEELSLDNLMPGARVTSGFGWRRHPFEGTRVHHDGVDLATGEESPVFVPRGGTVELAQENYGPEGKMGTVAIVDHGGGVKTFYAHLARLSVKAGDGLTGGDQIGFAGNTGVSSGPHLHFEVWKDGEKVDPARIDEVVGSN